MHQAIMEFSSRSSTTGLDRRRSVEGHLLSQLPGVAAGPLTDSPLEFIDTAGAGFDEELEPDGESRLNRREAELLQQKVQQLLAAGVAAGGYRGDRPLRRPGAAAAGTAARGGTGDRQRGRFSRTGERGGLISLVRSNRQGEIGFLSDIRRTNVA